MMNQRQWKRVLGPVVAALAATAWAACDPSAFAAETPASASAAPVPPAPPTPQVVAPGIWMIPGSFRPNRQPDGNTLIFSVGGSKYVVMDTGRHAWHRTAILDFIAARHGEIVAIVNSHWHLDHVSGNPALKQVYPKARVYASNAIDEALTGFLATSVASAKEYIAHNKLPPETLEDVHADMATYDNGAALKPDVPVLASRKLRFGSHELDLELAPNAATAGDVWVYDPKSKVVAAGDLVTLPAPFLDTACPEGWRRALAQVEAKPFKILVPGHGAPMGRAEFALYRHAYEGVIDCAKTSRPKAECGAEWAKAVEPLLGPDPAQRKRAQGMVEYYVQDVLRANGGKSATCKAA